MLSQGTQNRGLVPRLPRQAPKAPFLPPRPDWNVSLHPHQDPLSFPSVPWICVAFQGSGIGAEKCGMTQSVWAGDRCLPPALSQARPFRGKARPGSWPNVKGKQRRGPEGSASGREPCPKQKNPASPPPPPSSPGSAQHRQQAPQRALAGEAEVSAAPLERWGAALPHAGGGCMGLHQAPQHRVPGTSSPLEAYRSCSLLQLGPSRDPAGHPRLTPDSKTGRLAWC